MAHKMSLRTEQTASFGPFQLSASSRVLYRGDEPVSLGSRALDILIILVERAGEVVSRRELLALVWPDLTVAEANLRVHVTHLRKALGDGEATRYVANVPGRGYCFVASVARAAETPIKVASLPCAVSSSRPLVGLPPKLERMVGRDQTVAEVIALLSCYRLVSVVGAGGMGKTTVAVAVAHALVEEFKGAVHFVDAASISNVAQLDLAVESAFGVTRSSPELREAIGTSLSKRRALLVVDNCEHLIGDVAAVVEKLLAWSSELVVLTTSREALRTECERIHLLLPLSVPPVDAKLNVARASEWPAIQLFMDRAEASGYRGGFNDQNVALVANVCRQLDGMALAIELAASRVGAYGISGMISLLDNRFRLHWEGRRNALPRHKTMCAMLDWSHNLLTPLEQRTLAGLSIFHGQFTRSAAEKVLAESSWDELNIAQALSGLVEKSLVYVMSKDGDPLHRLLDTTRAYAMLKLEQSNDWNSLSRRHALYCCEFLRGARESGPEQVCGHRALLPDIRAALEWSFSRHGDSSIGFELAALAAPFLVNMALPNDRPLTFPYTPQFASLQNSTTQI